MTEAEWLACTEPTPMLEFLRGKASERKLRLFAVGCCRRVRHLLVPEGCEALVIAEKVAEGFVGSEERRRAREMAFHAGWVSDPSTAHRRGPAKAAVCDALARRAWEAATGVAWRISQIRSLESYHAPSQHWSVAKKGQDGLLAELLRCLFGNPYRRVAIDHGILAWNACMVVRLALAIYEACAFDRLPVLGDALEEAGCTNEDILSHCRSGGEHARGCWVVDLLLGKE